MFDEWTYKDTIGFIASISILYYFFGSFITFIIFLLVSVELNGESNV